MKTKYLALAIALVTTSSCKDKDANAVEGATKPISGEAQPAEPAASGGPMVKFKKFVTDLMTVDDLQSAYPAGKRFTLVATLKEPADCTQSQECRFALTEGKTERQFELDVAAKPKLDGKQAGAVITLDCAPVYEQGSYDPKPVIQIAKSCSVR